ncbi:FAD-binding oxidoreductase [Rhodospirillaceae bacterium]|jgi:glycine/D-amino acid oxidase-like deaminating enzyme|nr:FAD-binding oxidoreductase [Rhodospirillaceae bacterium]MBT6306403.1 FAD-binding oxidoreductase [Rhodospirillaceae bacterium]MDC0998296.1 FAD-dependent oxidoreductase [Alphaproteobacteria bacterium]MDC1441791.1 FAD-binding oxidoreductase [Rhodospirillaceae bacterium]
MNYDIVIIGGGIIGSSIAYHLARDGRAGTIAVIERDSTYAKAATPRGSGGIRQLFSLPENIEMARYGLDFYKNFDQTMTSSDNQISVAFRRQGYLFLSDGGSEKVMEQNFHNQQKLGVKAELLDKTQLLQLFPSIYNDDIKLAVYSPDDAWIDAYCALTGFKSKARALGVTYIGEEIKSAVIKDKKIKSLTCANGSTIAGDLFILAAGAWSGELAKYFDVNIPIEPMSRESYYFRCDKEMEPLPFIKTETDLAFRPEGEGFTGGMPDWSVKAGWNWELSPSRFEDTVWPALAQRIPSMETIRLERSWRGHYARNKLDYNAIIGPWVADPHNLFIATGFSGHGIMHAPAAGLAISELLLEGQYKTIDLTRFGAERIVTEKPYRELGIV